MIQDKEMILNICNAMQEGDQITQPTSRLLLENVILEISSLECKEHSNARAKESHVGSEVWRVLFHTVRHRGMRR